MYPAAYTTTSSLESAFIARLELHLNSEFNYTIQNNGIALFMYDSRFVVQGTIWATCGSIRCKVDDDIIFIPMSDPELAKHVVTWLKEKITA